MSDLSPAPGVPQTPTKAIVAAVGSLVTAVCLALLVVLSEGSEGGSSITGVEWVTLLLALVGAPAITGGVTYQAQNKPIS